MTRNSLVLATLLAIAACREPGAPPASAEATGAMAPLTPPSAAGLTTVLLADVPHVKQKPDFCGEACVEMAVRHLGKRASQDEVFAVAGIDPALGRGAITPELAHAVEKLGFRPSNPWSSIDASDPVPGLEAEFSRVHADLARGVPSILCMHYGPEPASSEHFRLIVGFDAETDEIVYHEPAVESGAYQRMPRAKLFELWPLKYKPDTWSLIRIPLELGTWTPPPAKGPGPSPADYVQHVHAMKDRVPAGFAIRVEPPFVVIGNGGADALEDHATGTVRWAVSKLRADFFDAMPNKVLDVWLFRDEPSYDRGVLSLTGEAPTTPYGFYSSVHGGLFMNISTGGGTLVHEIVHPFVEADFPDAPAWLNEGLGSLFEQSAERNGRIVGLTNWRLGGLQKAIRRGPLPTFQELAKMSDHTFYEEDRGTNYAQARYLFYYMQEQGLLTRFYEEFRKNRDKDPTGYATLVRVLDQKDMTAFQARWQEYVLGLRFR